MNRQFRKEDGLTVAELLATIAIASIVVIFITSVFVIVQKQYYSQQEDVSNLTDVKIALKSITRDIRKADEVNVENNDTITIKLDKATSIDYKFQGNSLLKNGAVYIYDVTDFKVEKEGSKITLEIMSGEHKESTTIILRSE